MILINAELMKLNSHKNSTQILYIKKKLDIYDILNAYLKNFIKEFRKLCWEKVLCDFIIVHCSWNWILSSSKNSNPALNIFFFFLEYNSDAFEHIA